MLCYGTLVASVNSVNLYLLQASALIAANQPHFAAVVDRRDRQTDGHQCTFSSPGLTPWIPRTVYPYF